MFCIKATLFRLAQGSGLIPVTGAYNFKEDINEEA